MKLFAMKLSSLLAGLVGVALLALLFGAFQPEQIPAWYAQYVPPQVQQFLDITRAEELLGLILVVFGLYGFLPKLPSKKNHRSVAFSGDHGDVVVHLDMVESTLTRVLSNMPEVKKIHVRVEAEGKGNKAKIVADCVLHDRPEVPARQAADAVNEYLADAAGSILGVEDIASVKLNIIGVEVNAKQSSLYLEAEHANRMKALEAKRLPPAPGLLAGAGPLPVETAPVMPIVPSQQAEPFVDAVVTEPAEDTNNLNAPVLTPSENTDPAIAQALDPLPSEDEEKERP
jgi:hypothetical protein